jgi:hypothetical protein
MQIKSQVIGPRIKIKRVKATKQRGGGVVEQCIYKQAPI